MVDRGRARPASAATTWRRPRPQFESLRERARGLVAAARPSAGAASSATRTPFIDQGVVATLEAEAASSRAELARGRGRARGARPRRGRAGRRRGRAGRRSGRQFEARLGRRRGRADAATPPRCGASWRPCGSAAIATTPSASACSARVAALDRAGRRASARGRTARASSCDAAEQAELPLVEALDGAEQGAPTPRRRSAAPTSALRGRRGRAPRVGGPRRGAGPGPRRGPSRAPAPSAWPASTACRHACSTWSRSTPAGSPPSRPPPARPSPRSWSTAPTPPAPALPALHGEPITGAVLALQAGAHRPRAGPAGRRAGPPPRPQRRPRRADVERLLDALVASAVVRRRWLARRARRRHRPPRRRRRHPRRRSLRRRRLAHRGRRFRRHRRGPRGGPPAGRRRRRPSSRRRAPQPRAPGPPSTRRRGPRPTLARRLDENDDRLDRRRPTACSGSRPSGARPRPRPRPCERHLDELAERPDREQARIAELEAALPGARGRRGRDRSSGAAPSARPARGSRSRPPRSAPARPTSRSAVVGGRASAAVPRASPGRDRARASAHGAERADAERRRLELDATLGGGRSAGRASSAERQARGRRASSAELRETPPPADRGGPGRRPAELDGSARERAEAERQLDRACASARSAPRSTTPRPSMRLEAADRGAAPRPRLRARRRHGRRVPGAARGRQPRRPRPRARARAAHHGPDQPARARGVRRAAGAPRVPARSSSTTSRRPAASSRKVIKAIDEEIVNVFAAAYADVSQNFTALFETLFPGGSGRLRLTEPDDLLEHRHRGRGQAVGQERQEALAAVGWRALADRPGLPVRRVPQPAVALLRDGRGRGRARRRQPAPLPRASSHEFRAEAQLHHREPPEAHDGGGRLPLRRHHAAGRLDPGRQREGRRHRVSGSRQPVGVGGTRRSSAAGRWGVRRLAVTGTRWRRGRHDGRERRAGTTAVPGATRYHDVHRVGAGIGGFGQPGVDDPGRRRRSDREGRVTGAVSGRRSHRRTPPGPTTGTPAVRLPPRRRRLRAAAEPTLGQHRPDGSQCRTPWSRPTLVGARVAGVGRAQAAGAKRSGRSGGTAVLLWPR